ncbi:TonB-dependent receptor [Stenotrophomonas sp. ESTM1D_MKCIP4_1]|uniref:TonB-dependent receptor n=1 Tax=Stenotrophomonas sp. ESTM1D_MKCIP4_1 TaxID=2072414 RepID=UPI000D541A8A|nr:TonB-dependent receptor [Stenotrophomonas sp. ESTM1D_MKCIP4_1]AWH55469.1 TonB-dependent receptor [Stenotrophomonas sp. ESTM1D_MKCIP4_1]
MIGVLLASGPVLAQEAPPASTAGKAVSATNLDSIKVTARKREETLQEVPVAVTAFTSGALDKLNVQDISALGPQVPNMTIYAARGASSTVTAYIRGVGQSDPTWGSDPGVGIYLDDVYIARPQGALLDVFDVSRIEVLRGPQGTLYGKNTIGGAIKYISRGLPTETEGFAQITVGNYSQLDAKAAIGGPIGGADSGLRARVAVASMNNDGFGENTFNGQPVSDKQINAARFNLGAYAGDDFDVQFALDWTDDRSGMRGSKMLAPNPFLPGYPPMDSRYDIRSGMRNLNNVESKGASATVNWRPNEDVALKYVIAKRESDSQGNVDFDTTPVKLADVSGTYDDNQVSNELQLNYDAGGRVRGVVGLYQFKGEAGGQIQNNYFSVQFADNQGKVLTDSIALYADWTFDLTQKLKLDVGARYTDEDKRAIVLNRLYADPGFTRPVAVTADFDKKTNFSNVSPKVSLDYQITPDIMVYGLATRGFKSGGYNIRANAVAVPRSAEPFDDEAVDSFEIGSKMGFFDQRLFLNLSAFHNKYKDIQLSVFTGIDTNGDGVDDSFFGDFTNAGKGTVNGLEIEYQYLPTQHWLISGNLAWLDAKYDEYMDRGINVARQMKFTNAPEYSGALNVEYRTALANGGNLSARVSYSYQSEVWPTTDLSPVIRQGGYGLVNAGVVWRVDDAWTLSLQGTNLADKEYRTTGYNIPAVGTLIGFYGAPRQYSLSARYDF